MHIGVVLPQTEIGPDVGAVRAYGQGVDELGFHHLVAYDHVVGADPAVHVGWDGPYDIDTQFHEPFVVFGYLAACTSLELVTGITILPQRPTALVAKQAAEVDLLTGGRFRLGVGIGWNAVEYETLGQDFSTRDGASRSRSDCCARCGPPVLSPSRPWTTLELRYPPRSRATFWLHMSCLFDPILLFLLPLLRSCLICTPAQADRMLHSIERQQGISDVTAGISGDVSIDGHSVNALAGRPSGDHSC